jgi:tetratricopeptide (TPR) repeat protein
MIIGAASAAIHFYARKYDRALAELRSVLDMDPDFGPAYLVHGQILYSRGDPDKAVDKMVTGWRLFGQRKLAELIESTRRTRGAEAASRRMVEYIIENPGILDSSQMFAASVYASLGEKDKTIERIRLGAAGREPETVFLGIDPCYDPLRSDPRFQEILRQIGLWDKS